MRGRSRPSAEVTEYVLKEIGVHQWLVLADRQSIALCADENEAVKVMTEHSARGSRLGTSSVDNWSEQNPPALAHAAGHEAPDDDLAVKPHRPNHRASRPVRFGDQGFVWNIDPFVLKTDSIVAVLRIPIGICDRETVCERTT